MCGIAGVFHYARKGTSVDRESLFGVTECLRHRGPDDKGYYIDEAAGLGIGHRRLAIVDLSPTGHQPMGNEAGDCWITYNGEIYNHSEFRKRLLNHGHVLRGSSDTETLLHLFEERGPGCLGDLAGIFAFAFWDARTRRLTLVRDPLGVKQLYYHDDGSRIAFASEIKALLKWPDVPRQMDQEGVNEYLHFHTTLFDRTFFAGIKQVRAGEYIEVSERGLVRRIYWRMNDFQSSYTSAETAVLALREQLAEVVKSQLMSDVPVGSFFSGGIDSSSVAAFALRTGSPPECFGVHFTNQGVVDERPYQQAAARELGLKLHLITLDGSSFPEDLMRLMYYQDQPAIGTAMFPMYYVSKLAARHVKVCLGGQGADEVFGGYARYALTSPGRLLSTWLLRAPALGGNRSDRRVGGSLAKQLLDLRNAARLGKAMLHFGNWKARYFENFAKVPESMFRDVFLDSTLPSRSSCRELFLDAIAASPGIQPADKVMHWDLMTYLPGLFHQDDRMSMACSLESRVPFADPRLVVFAFHVGWKWKLRAGTSKWILRQAVSDVIPTLVLNRKKIGFDTPAEAWIKHQHRDFVKDLLTSRAARERGVWNRCGIDKLLASENQPGWFDLAWKVICIEAWAKIFLDAHSPVDTEFDFSEQMQSVQFATAS